MRRGDEEGQGHRETWEGHRQGHQPWVTITCLSPRLLRERTCTSCGQETGNPLRWSKRSERAREAWESKPEAEGREPEVPPPLRRFPGSGVTWRSLPIPSGLLSGRYRHLPNSAAHRNQSKYNMFLIWKRFWRTLDSFWTLWNLIIVWKTGWIPHFCSSLHQMRKFIVLSTEIKTFFLLTGGGGRFAQCRDLCVYFYGKVPNSRSLVLQVSQGKFTYGNCELRNKCHHSVTHAIWPFPEIHFVPRGKATIGIKPVNLYVTGSETSTSIEIKANCSVTETEVALKAVKVETSIMYMKCGDKTRWDSCRYWRVPLVKPSTYCISLTRNPFAFIQSEVTKDSLTPSGLWSCINHLCGKQQLVSVIY